MCGEDYGRFGELRMIMHQVYEFRKGIRNLVLCTITPECAEIVKARLQKQDIAWHEQPVSPAKVNLYFGDRNCLDAVRCFADKPLNRLTPEEDYMLGTMLGYDIRMQCERFCRRRSVVSAI